MKKRILTLLLIFCCVFGVGNFVSASTIPFDITVTAYGPSNPDPYSYREIKDDDEQKYYVRATSMDHERGLFTFKSCSIDGTVDSGVASYHYRELNTTRSYGYTCGYAPGGKYYYLHGITGLYEAAPYNYLHILGYYCP